MKTFLAFFFALIIIQSYDSKSQGTLPWGIYCFDTLQPNQYTYDAAYVGLIDFPGATQRFMFYHRFFIDSSDGNSETIDIVYGDIYSGGILTAELLDSLASPTFDKTNFYLNMHRELADSLMNLEFQGKSPFIKAQYNCIQPPGTRKYKLRFFINNSCSMYCYSFNTELNLWNMSRIKCASEGCCKLEITYCWNFTTNSLQKSETLYPYGNYDDCSYSIPPPNYITSCPGTITDPLNLIVTVTPNQTYGTPCFNICD